MSLKNRAPLSDFQLAYDTTKVLYAAYQSAEEGRKNRILIKSIMVKMVKERMGIYSIFLYHIAVWLIMLETG